jgi:transcription antitermination factor NusG
MRNGTQNSGAMFKAIAIHETTATHESPQWYAIRTRARHEKRVAHQLQEKGIFTYLPMLSEVHNWSDRRKNVDVPLFSCYSFVRLLPSVEAHLAILRTPGVVGFLGTPGRASSIPDKQIEDIQTALAHNGACSRYPFLRVGQRVRVRGGSLDGIEGVLVALRDGRSLVISVGPILQSLAIRIEGYRVEIISAPRSSAA